MNRPIWLAEQEAARGFPFSLIEQDVSSPTEAAWVFLTQWWRISGACTSPECGFTGERGKVLVLQMVWRCLRVSVQMQKGQLPERPPPDLPHLHLRQRGSVGDPALRPLGCQSHPGSPAQRNHPGGRQQRRRWVEKDGFLSQIANKEKEIKHLPAGADEERTEQPEGDRRLPVGLLVWRMACSLLTSHQMIDIILPGQPPQRFFFRTCKGYDYFLSLLIRFCPFCKADMCIEVISNDTAAFQAKDLFCFWCESWAEMIYWDLKVWK